MTTTPPTLGDLAKRLYDKFAATQELLEPKKLQFLPTRWDELPEWRQEVWVTVAAEAVKVGAEIQQEIERRKEKEREERRAAQRTFVEKLFEGRTDVKHLWQAIDILHAEHHPGIFVPTIDACTMTGHTRERYAELVKNSGLDLSLEQMETGKGRVLHDCE